jgi:hypothetical protein
MKNILLIKPNKTKIYLTTLLVLMILTEIIAGAVYINEWYNTHLIIYRSPVKVGFYSPISIELRKEKIIEKKIIMDYPDQIDTPIKKYICDKFGAYDCKIALAIVQAESGFNDQAIGSNTNGSVDLGLWQINFPTHKGTISPKDALDPYKATDWAYAKYKRDGNFNAWVAFTTDKYLVHYEK